eukprot:6188161-Pleurochrysis_carterae.AAC.2
MVIKPDADKFSELLAFNEESGSAEGGALGGGRMPPLPRQTHMPAKRTHALPVHLCKYTACLSL